MSTPKTYFFVRNKDGSFPNPAGTQRLAPHLYASRGKAAGPHKRAIEKGLVEVVEVQLIEIKPNTESIQQ